MKKILLMLLLGFVASINCDAQFLKKLGKAVLGGLTYNSQQNTQQRQVQPSVHFSNMRLTYDQKDQSNGRTMLQVHYTLTVNGLQGHNLVPVLAIEIPQGTYHKFADGNNMISEGNQLTCTYPSTVFNGQWQAIYVDALNPLPGQNTYYARIYLVDMTLQRQIAQSDYLSFYNTGEQPAQASSNQQQAQSNNYNQNQSKETPSKKQKPLEITAKVFSEAVYPSGSWFLYPEESSENQRELQITVNRRKDFNGIDIPEWGSILYFLGNDDFEGTLDNPRKEGNVYVFDVISEKGNNAGTIGLRKVRLSDGGTVVEVAQISGVIAKWVKGQQLTPQPWNGIEYDPTLDAVTEAEFAKALNGLNENTLVNYWWWKYLLSLNSPASQKNKTSNVVKTFVLGNGKLGPICIGDDVRYLPNTIPGLYDTFTYFKGYEKVYSMGMEDDDEAEEVLEERVTFIKNGKEIVSAGVDDGKIVSFLVGEGASFIRTTNGFHVGSSVRELFRKNPKLNWQRIYFENVVEATSKDYVYTMDSDDLPNTDNPRRAEDFKPTAKIISIYHGKRN
ncbi:MAG: hypothetical protein IJ190_13660 [Prevotella sp.]|nr:hypothetical protein [Prevotella sp.]